jgi:hypothetical protein
VQEAYGRVISAIRTATVRDAMALRSLQTYAETNLESLSIAEAITAFERAAAALTRVVQR